MNSIYLIVLVLGLTFSLTIVKQSAKSIEKVLSLNSEIVSKSYIIWFALIIAAGAYFGKDVGVSIPQIAPELNEFSVIVIVICIVMFAKYSEYSSSRSKEWIVSFTIIFPIAEEVLFRGIIQFLLERHTFFSDMVLTIPIFGQTQLLVLTSAIAFGVMHIQYNNFKIDNRTVKQVLFAFVFGLYAGKLAIRTGSILYPVLMHVAANSMSLVYGLMTSKESIAKSKTAN